MELILIGVGLLAVGFLVGALVFRKNGAKLEKEAAELREMLLNADGIMRTKVGDVSGQLKVRLEKLREDIENRVNRVIK